jgi:uncharacterized protein (TIGR03067 family)
MLRSAIAVVVATITLSVARAEEKPEVKALAELQGSWEIAYIEVNGQEKELGGKQFQWTIKGKSLSFCGEEFATLSVDGTGKPKSIDVFFEGSKEPKEGVYAIDGDKLKLCLNWKEEGKNERPQEFTTKENASFRVIEFQRVKDAKQAASSLGFVGLQLKRLEKGGIMVVSTLENSPAKKAGLLPEDLLLEINGKPSSDLFETVNQVREGKPGSELKLVVDRKGEKKQLKVKVGVFPVKFLLD